MTPISKKGRHPQGVTARHCLAETIAYAALSFTRRIRFAAFVRRS
jgi:hypothetical protein